jgi:hypothetical protein
MFHAHITPQEILKLRMFLFLNMGREAKGLGAGWQQAVTGI